MRVYLAATGVIERRRSPILAFERLASTDVRGRHGLVDDPEEADLMLFTECHLLGTDWRLTAIRDSDDHRRFPSKTMVYDERDRPWGAFPGVYVSMPKRFFNPPGMESGA